MRQQGYQWELRKEFRLFWGSKEGGEGMKEGMDDAIMMSKARQENKISGREKLNIFYSNSRSLNNKMEELEAKVDNKEYDIVAVSETWLKEESNWRTGLEGYKVYRCDRRWSSNLGKGQHCIKRKG